MDSRRVGTPLGGVSCLGVPKAKKCRRMQISKMQTCTSVDQGDLAEGNIKNLIFLITRLDFWVCVNWWGEFESAAHEWSPTYSSKMKWSGTTERLKYLFTHLVVGLSSTTLSAINIFEHKCPMCYAMIPQTDFSINRSNRLVKGLRKVRAEIGRLFWWEN